MRDLKRRSFLSVALAIACSSQPTHRRTLGQDRPELAPKQSDRGLGLLWGGLIGDALGGPIEFADRVPDSFFRVRLRGVDYRLTAADLEQLGEAINLLSYQQLRPDAAAYGPWRNNAPAGTVTDDSRHKIVLLQAFENSQAQGREITREDIARAFLQFQPIERAGDAEQLAALNAEGFREYRYASRWLLGERDLEWARPVERLWAGVNNCSGQMMFPPLAVAFAGQPEEAYRKTFELDFIDTPLARDITSALVAGLSAVLAPELDNATPADRLQVFSTALRQTDPFGFKEVPYAGRQLDRWLDKAQELAQRAEGKPAKLYALLETEGKPVYWWDAHFTILVPICMLHFCEQNPWAAMHLTLDFGHDTDSYAQVLGCIMGAVYGTSIFPVQTRRSVGQAMLHDYGVHVEQWLETLRA
ncbi:MAG: ADP-ribosylglycohydrolase family protein [bacterium]|nr:ADP-ribosylglycohydrolase family protein [bacterium]